MTRRGLFSNFHSGFHSWGYDIRAVDYYLGRPGGNLPINIPLKCLFYGSKYIMELNYS